MTELEIADKDDGILVSERHTSFIKFMEGEKFKILPYQRYSMMETDKFISELSGGVLGFKCPDILPRNCRYYSSDPTDGEMSFVIEIPPSVRTIKLNMDVTYYLEALKMQGKEEAYGYKGLKIGNPPHPFRLSFPYMIFLIFLDQSARYRFCRVFFRTSPLVSLQDFLLKPNLFNVDSSGNMCIAGHEPPSAVKALGNLSSSVVNLNERITQVLDRVWSNAFNTEFHGASQMYRNIQELSNPFEWQYLSKSDPMFILRAPWIKHERNLSKELQLIEDNKRRNDGSSVIDKLRSVVFGRNAAKKGQFIERSMIESVYLQSEDIQGDDDNDEDIEISSSATSYTLSVGDQIELNKKKHYVTAFKYPDNGSGEISSVELEDEEGNKIDQKFDQRFKNKVIKSLMRKEVKEITTKSGKTIKKGDIIALRIPGYNKLMTVDFVRVSRDGLSEVKSGGNVFLVDFVNFDIIDPSNIVIEGIKFIKGDRFLVKSTSDKVLDKVIQGFITTFESMQNNKLLFKVEGKDKILKVDILGSVAASVSKIEGTLESIPAVRILNRIAISGPMNQILKSENQKIIVPGEPLYLSDNVREWQNVVSNTILLENGTRFFLPSYDVDIDLRVGDFVVLSNWVAPSESLKIRKIVRFELAGRRLNVITAVDGEPEVSVPLCDFGYGTVSAGCVRKAAFSVDGLTIGMEVIPKQRVTGFLKSKPSRISAFIVDEKVPLVLCNNFHTFWLTQENRNLFRFNASPSPASTEHKVKLSVQLGDLFCSEGYDRDLFELMFFTYYRNRTFRRMSGVGGVRWIRTTTGQPKIQNYLQYGFPTQKRKEIKADAVPNFFSWYVNDDGISRNIM